MRSCTQLALKDELLNAGNPVMFVVEIG